MRMPGVPLRPILGNHDLERESGNGKQPKGTMQERFLQMFQLDKPYGVLEFENYRFFFASTEPQSPDSCYDVQEVFASDEQFAWLTGKLKERPNVPVIFLLTLPRSVPGCARCRASTYGRRTLTWTKTMILTGGIIYSKIVRKSSCGFRPIII
ncbi:hypothetical protein PACILC2_17100 [Paenibacillus cisolokensis]|uniref:Calcineurin-like phosphoesterase domain-containing protein n=1 Tax=Paenibacillus cisolokensis TaxID=1658519 RepID=A0ABQ4N4R7_9BACL|nr:hypothetical protein PACILC2_17100 [Paenibacillus cisolokensis]